MPNQAVLASFKKRRLLASVLIVSWLGLLAVATLERDALPLWFMQGAVGWCTVSMALLLWKWRCPSCNAYLGGATMPRFCSRCGVSFSETNSPRSPAPAAPQVLEVGERLRLEPEHLRLTERLVITGADAAPIYWAERRRRAARELLGLLGTVVVAISATSGAAMVIASLPGTLAGWHLAVLAVVFVGALLGAGFLLTPARQTLVFSDAERKQVVLELFQQARRFTSPRIDVRGSGLRPCVIEGTTAGAWVGGPYVLRATDGGVLISAEPNGGRHVLQRRPEQGTAGFVGAITREPGRPTTLELSPGISEETKRLALAVALAQWLDGAG